jgi:serine phosphatase RsbU (regulator of sigma subunit)
LGLIVGDISGKGIAAALLMANLQANIRSQLAVAVSDPHGFLQSVNRLFYESTTEAHYATVFFAGYSDQTQHLRYANCGHLPGLLLRSDGALARLGATSTVLGLFRDWECAVEELTLTAGDTLLLYTDGVTERFNDSGEEFGEKRLVDALARYQELPAKALLEAVLDEVRHFGPQEQTDDLTLIVAKVHSN